MIEIIDINDSRAVRNKNNVLGFYDLVINQKKSEEFVGKFISPAYIQHNPIIANGSDALGKFFGKITRERARARVVVHRIIAVGDYVWAHVNFLNLFNDDPNDTGIAGVDIYKMDADGRAIEGPRPAYRGGIARRGERQRDPPWRTMCARRMRGIAAGAGLSAR